LLTWIFGAANLVIHDMTATADDYDIPGNAGGTIIIEAVNDLWLSNRF